MLLKYLNELDEAIRRADREPGPESRALCCQRRRVLEEYLATQMEPVRRRGQEILARMAPPAMPPSGPSSGH